MHSETWLARLVLVAGAAVLVATSAPPRWGATKRLQEALDSPEGGDKLRRVHVLMDGALAQDTGTLELALYGSADRPAYDLELVWSEPLADASAEGAPVRLASSGDFTSVHARHTSYPDCPPSGTCEVVLEGRISALEAEPYALDLRLEISIRGSREDRPRGRFEVSSEVVDAP